MAARSAPAQRRTARPGLWRQLAVLVRKQLRVDRKAPGAPILRTVLGPVVLVLYGINYLSSYSQFASEDPAGKITTYDPLPTATFGLPDLTQEGRSIVLGAAPNTDLAVIGGAVEALNHTAPGNLAFSDTSSAEAFQAEVAALGPELFAGVFFEVRDEVLNYRIYVAGEAAPGTKIDGAANDVLLTTLINGIYGVQRLVETAAIYAAGGAPVAAAEPIFLQKIPTRSGGNSPDWYLLWMPGFYINIGVMFMLGFYLTPLIADQRKEVVRQFMLMGVPQAIYWAHWMIVFTISMFVTAILYTVVFIEMRFVALANPFLLFLSFFFLLFQFAAFTVIVPNYVKREEVAGIVPFLAWIFSSASVIVCFLADTPDAVLAILTVLNPWWAAFNFTSLFVEYDWAGFNVGIGFDNAVESGWLTSFVAQIAGCIFWLFLVWYIYRAPSSKNIDESPSKGGSKDADKIAPLPENADVILSVRNLQKNFETPQGPCKKPIVTRALRSLDMDVCRGEVFGFLGHNGAGKTTAMSILAGEILPDGGVAQFHFPEGTFKVGHGHDNHIRSRIGVCPQMDILFDNLSCREHLELFAELKGGIEVAEGQTDTDAIKAEVERRLRDLKFTTEGDEHNPVKTYSGGMKRKVSIAIAMLGNPEMIFLDEPTAGMDPVNRRVVWEMISEAKKGRSVILITHFMDEADVLSDRIGILNRGKLVACGSSLFLKHKFGAGYTLSYHIAKSKATSIKATVTGSVSSAEFQFEQPISRTKADEVLHHWSLPHGTEPQFAKLLTALHETGCTNTTVDLTTLESVFLKTGSETGGEDVDDDDATSVATRETPGNKDEDLENQHGNAHASEEELIRDIWVDSRKEKQPVSWWSKVRTVAGVSARQSRRDTESIFFGIGMPVAYLAAGFIAGYFVSDQEDIVTPVPIGFNVSSVLEPDYTEDVATVFGLPNPALLDPLPSGLAVETAVPETITEFFAKYFLGGILPNSTLMYNATVTQGLPVLQSLLTNYSLAASAPDDAAYSAVLGELVPLPYPRVDPFPLLPFLTPMFLGIGFMPLAFLLIDLAFFKEYQLYGVLRLMGVSRFTAYVGVAVQTLVIVFFPFFLTAIILGFALSNPVVGSGGRWLAFIVTMLAYCYAVVPFGMMFEPLFPNMQSAKNWWPFIWVMLTIIPFIAFSISLASIDNPDTAALLGDVLCIIPPMAFQRSLREILSLSTKFDDASVTSERVWAWETRIVLCILLLFLVGTVSWMVVIFQVRRAEARALGGNAEAKPLTDEDVKAERENSMVSAEGINARDLVKSFRITPDTNEYKFRYAQMLYWFKWLFTCKDPFLSQYETKEAVKGVSFGVHKNELFILLGPNGSGKTVTTKMLTRDIVQDGGKVILGGRPEGTPQSYIDLYNEGRVGYCPQFDALFTNLSVAEHFDFAARLRGLDPSHEGTKRHFHAIQVKLGLDRHLKKQARYLSGGYKRKLGLAMSLVGFPEMLFHDEISTGVDPAARRSIWTVLKPDQLRGDDDFDLPAIMLSTHYMDEAQELATRLAIMIDGEIITTGTLARLQEKHVDQNFLEVTFKDGFPADIEDQLIEHLRSKGLEPTVYESLVGRLKLQFPVRDMSANAKNLANLFSLVEEIKERMHIDFYNVSIKNLEQIFIELSRRQFEINAASKKSRSGAAAASSYGEP